MEGNALYSQRMSWFRATRRVDGPGGLVTQVLWPALRVVVTLPYTAGRALTARTRTVEAIAFYPHETRYAWTTTPAEVGRVVDEVAAALAAGRIARPAGAAYLGERHEAN